MGKPRRRPRGDARSTVRVDFWVTPSEVAALRKVAAAERQPMARVVRDAVNEFVADFGERAVFRTAAARPTPTRKES